MSLKALPITVIQVHRNQKQRGILGMYSMCHCVICTAGRIGFHYFTALWELKEAQIKIFWRGWEFFGGEYAYEQYSPHTKE